MTKRDFFTAIMNGETPDERMRAIAAKALESMDKAAEKRRSTPSKTAIANREIGAKILDYLTENGTQTTETVANVFGISTAKVTAAIKDYVAAGSIVKGKAKDGKSVRVTLSAA